MFVRLTAAAVVLSLIAAPGVALAAGKPLRALAFDVGYSVASSSERNENGITAGSGSGGAFNVDDAGTMRVDVVAVTADGGLVVDTSYAGKVTNQPAVRVAIFPDGRLGFDPAKAPCPQALYVLPMLARKVFADRDLEKGSSWSTKIDAPAATTTYRVVDVDTPVATIAVDRTLVAGTSRDYQEHETGTMRYATDLLTPLRMDMFIHSRRATLERIETADTHLLATLKSDSFATPHS